MSEFEPRDPLDPLGINAASSEDAEEPADGGAADGVQRIASIQDTERLAETLNDRPGGEWFQADLAEARVMAEHDPRFKELAEGLEAETLGGRLEAINAFFDQISPIELAGLTLPPNLSQLRAIYLSSRS